jgi:hypothetical protein
MKIQFKEIVLRRLRTVPEPQPQVQAPGIEAPSNAGAAGSSASNICCGDLYPTGAPATSCGCCDPCGCRCGTPRRARTWRQRGCCR